MERLVPKPKRDSLTLEHGPCARSDVETRKPIAQCRQSKAPCCKISHFISRSKCLLNWHVPQVLSQPRTPIHMNNSSSSFLPPLLPFPLALVSPLGIFFSTLLNLDTDPDNTNHNIHPSLLSLSKLKAPHAILSLIPICACRTVHPPSAGVLLDGSLLGLGHCE